MRKMVRIILYMMLLSLLVACLDKTTNNDHSKVIYYIPIDEFGTYWTSVKQGAIDRSKELGYELVIRTTSPGDAQKNEKHLGFISEAMSRNVAGIALAPMDPDMFDRKSAEVHISGIPLVTFDADVKNPENRVTYVGTNNYEAGAILGRSGALYLKERGVTGGSIGTVVSLLTQTTMVDRLEGAKAGFAEVMGANIANFTWLETIADEHQAANSKRQVEAQIVANPNMVAIFSFSSLGSDVGTMEALRAREKFHHAIPHFGFDYTPTWDNGIEQGLIAGIVDQDPYMMGRSVIDAIDRIVKGEQLPSNSFIPVHWILAEDLEAYGQSKNHIVQ